MGRSRRKRSKHRHYGNVEILQRERVYPVGLLDDLPQSGTHYVLDGRRIEINNLRIQTLRKKGLICAGCRAEACLAALELVQSPAYCGWALNFYARTEAGIEVVFTKDHIVPRSKGGPDDLANLQPMCWTCNQRKGDRLVLGA